VRGCLSLQGTLDKLLTRKTWSSSLRFFAKWDGLFEIASMLLHALLHLLKGGSATGVLITDNSHNTMR